MKYGLIGEKLPHSFSKEIHESIAGYTYELCPLAPDEIEGFLDERNFAAVNVTIPYKQAVIPHLDHVDPAAEAIGAVNTIVNNDGRLYGYNTDFAGMTELIRRLGVDMSGSTVLILGTGGTSRTAAAVAEGLGAARAVRVGRRGGDSVVTYEEACERFAHADFIINTTPCGMYPNQNGGEGFAASPISLERFTCLRGVLDAVYNPLRTNLVLDAMERGIPAEGGLYMLVSQAVRASEYFTGSKLPPSVTDSAFRRVLLSKENVILIGMPGCGKTTVGKLIANKMGRSFVDTDDVIREIVGKSIPEIFEEQGEPGFRDIETEAVNQVTSSYTGAVIATGGGAVLRGSNVRMLKRCGKIFFIDRPISEILPTSDRPTSSDRTALESRYRERYNIYTGTADYHIKTDGVPSHTCDKIIAALSGIK